MFKKYFLILCAILSVGSVSVGAASASDAVGSSDGMDVDDTETVRFFLRRQVGVEADGKPKWSLKEPVTAPANMTYGQWVGQLKKKEPGVRTSVNGYLEEQGGLGEFRHELVLGEMASKLRNFIVYVHSPA
jgi:hypothetical protein